MCRVAQPPLILGPVNMARFIEKDAHRLEFDLNLAALTSASRYAVVQNSAKISLEKCTSPLDKNTQLPNLVIVTMLEANLELAWEIRFRPEAQFCRSWRKSAPPSRPSGLNNYCVSRTHIWGPGRFGRRGPFLFPNRNGRQVCDRSAGPPRAYNRPISQASELTFNTGATSVGNNEARAGCCQYCCQLRVALKPKSPQLIRVAGFI
jgi:hypothetical protein